jgi:hypothetical protein
VIADLLRELQGLTEVVETLLAAAEIGQIVADNHERSDLCLACADAPRESECPLGGRQRLLMAASQHQSARECSECVRALGGGRLGWDDLDAALERGEGGIVVAEFVQVLAEVDLEQTRAVRLLSTDELDRSACELDRAGRGADVTGEPGRSVAQLGDVEADEVGRIRYRVPERERALEVR